MSTSFPALVEMASGGGRTFAVVSRDECVAAAREFAKRRWEEIRERHHAGESGGNILRRLTETADTLLGGVFRFALQQVANPRTVWSRVSLCALGGYGRGELSPGSDLDVCLLYEGALDEQVEKLNGYLLPFLWDMGFTIGYGVRSVSEAVALARDDIRAFTSMMEGRLIAGDNTAFARLRLSVRELQAGEMFTTFVRRKVADRYDALAREYRDVYRPEPNIKENAGGLRDFHTGLWLFMISHGSMSLDEVVGQGLISQDEHLDLANGLDFVWRVRNELHFRAGKVEDRLTFANQRHVAKTFGYGDDEHPNMSRLMEDYYAAANKLRRFLHIAVQTCDPQRAVPLTMEAEPSLDGAIVDHGELHVGISDEQWFAENPARLMIVFWDCARRKAHLSRATERQVIRNLHLVGDAFRSSDVVRRFFLAICNRPADAAHALRQMTNVGLLGLYLPEFAAVQGVIRYQDFHHYPVHEHTLRALDALADVRAIEGPVGRCLIEAFEGLAEPYILVLALLFHDLGKVGDEEHVEESVRIAREICQRIGLPEDDAERILFLVRHHLAMTTISQYRDVDEEDIVHGFAETVKTEDRVRALFLLSYADLRAVGPSVWNEWKGTLLMQLYLKTVKRLLGRVETVDEAFWLSPKADRVRTALYEELRPDVEQHLHGLGQRYFVAFTPEEIATHIRCVASARRHGLALHLSENTQAAMSDVVIATWDRQGLFAQIAGSFAAQLLDVNAAALFTRPDGLVVDCFKVTDPRHRRPLTGLQFEAFERTLHAVLLDDEDVQELVDQSRRRIFALLQPRIPVRTQIAFDNDSSRTHTVIDVETGDRTGVLYDMARAMADAGLNIASARIVTDARRVRDSFYVTLYEGKIETEREQMRIRDELYAAIHPRSFVESKGGSV